MAQLDNYNLLIAKLDEFIRKYYVNQLIRGVLYSTGLIVFLFLLFNTLEYYFYFPTTVRKLMFWSFGIISLWSLFSWVFTPILHYFRLGKLITHEKAASIIGSHFSNVKDKLLNILQLRQQATLEQQTELINASINQKSEEIKFVPFQSAINLYQNKKYLRYALPPLLLLFAILFGAPSIIREGSKRLINNDKVFEKDAPFHFNIDPNKLQVVQFNDYDLVVKVDGSILPNDVFIDMHNYQYRLNKIDANTFSYKFTNVQKDTPFKLFSGSVQSKDYNLSVLKKPSIANFDVKLAYPAYLGRTAESFANVGDLVVPAGTNIDWIFNTQNTENVAIKFASKGDKEENIQRTGTDVFSYRKRAIQDEAYKIYVSNKVLPNADSVGYTITVIPDAYPTINVDKFNDSLNLNSKVLYFVGDASDDYGLIGVTFNYRIKKQDGKEGELVTLRLPKPEAKQYQYSHTLDIQSLNLEPGDQVSYYFEAFDNDGVNGSKSSKTQMMSYNMPSKDEMQQKEAKNNDEIKKDLEKAHEESKRIQDEMNKLREKLLTQKDVDWQTKKQLEKLVNQQKELDKQVEKAQQNFQDNLNNQKEFKQTDQRIAEKQEELKKMFDAFEDPEMKELIKKIEEMLEKLDKDKALDMMKDFQLNDEQLEKELDRTKELFKQMEWESQMQDQIDKLEELAKKEEDLSKETENNEKSPDDLKQKQDDIQKDFEKTQDKLKDLDKKNEELDHKNKTPDTKELQQDIKKDMKDSKSNLDQKNNSKASKSQKGASKKMKDMANEMKNAMQGGQQEEMEEDMAALRQLLENLINLSFDQEGLMGDFGKVADNTPRYVKLVQQQYKLKDNFGLIEDSLQALGKRVFQLQAMITEKVTDIKSNMKDGINLLEDRKRLQAGEFQQRTMKNINDLALMLNESMNAMQQQMSSEQQGNQSCKKPGGKKPNGKGGVPKDQISEGQKGLNQSLKDLQQRMQNGKGGMGSKEFAEMAAKQAAVRRALEQKQKELQQRGQGDKGLQDLINQMDKTETELVNKQLTNETMKRQSDILTRLLESEKAERERDLDEKRKAEVAREKEKTIPPSLQEYIKKRQAEVEQLKTVSPNLRPFYRQLVEDYFKTLKVK